MNYRSLLALAMAGLASAQKSSVTSMLMYGADPQPLAASIVGNDATATTYSINCPSGTPGDECGMGPGLTLIAGPKTTTYQISYDTFKWSVECAVAGTTSASCADYHSGGNDPEGTVTTTLTSDLPFYPVTVTAGSVTEADSSATTTTAKATGSGASATTSAATGESTADSAASGTASQSTGGMAQVTADARGLLGGAAVALVAAVL